ncbi:MAG: NnrS family protein [Bdellovibrionaceae bacterium]|nr:NnrS family protein [Pseudobdellovibrionaceae bacterium]
MNDLKKIEPYRVLFPIGLVFGCLGVYVWVAYALFEGSSYPVQLHSHLMMGSFLFSFVAGFLMTAVPKMTASFPAKPYEIFLAFMLILGISFFAQWGRSEYFYFMSGFSIGCLVLFFIRRFLSRTKNPPAFFPFVVLGLLCGLTGCILLAVNCSSDFTSPIVLFGKKIYFEGMILLLVLGVGSRLIPVISGRAVIPETSEVQVALKNFALGSILISAYALESNQHNLLGGILKSIVATWVAVFNWGIFESAQSKSRLALGMRVSGLMVLLGIYMSVLQPAFAIHWMHLTFIAGFGLMTLTVASRVTLAHGSYDLSFEARSKSLWISGALILTAAATRVAAPYISSGYVRHLAYAGVVWILALAVWGVVFVKRMIWKGSDQPSC